MDLGPCECEQLYGFDLLVNITSFKLRKPVKLFHVPFFNLGSGFMGPLLNS
jgi:hypothetical protein